MRQWCPPVVYLGGGGKREGWPFLGRRSAISGQEKKKFSLSLLSRQRLKGVSLPSRPPTNTVGESENINVVLAAKAEVSYFGG